MLNNESSDRDKPSKIEEQRIACLSYAFFFAVPLLFSISSNLLFCAFFLTSTFFLAFGIIAPAKLQRVNKALNVPFSLIHFFLSQVFLFVFYFFILTPFALIFRILGRNLVSLNMDKSRASYWKSSEESRNWQQFFKDPF
jgi:hypothetical protein